jgi:exopolysaccharide biosynthesis polyprenyl glycosylphosphotransferase
LLDLLMPAPLQGRMGWVRFRSTAAAFGLVTLNWLLLGGLLVALHALFPQKRIFGYAAGAPSTLLGIALLHATLITLIAHAEGLRTFTTELRGQPWILGKSVLWATGLLCLAYTLQGASWTVSGLITIAGILHFTALRVRQCHIAKHERSPGDGVRNIRNVLIVGAGRLGCRVAVDVKSHPESGRKLYGLLDDRALLEGGVIGRVRDLPELARRGFVDGIILATPHDRNLTLRVLREARRLHLDVEMAPDLFGCRSDSEFEQIGSSTVISLHSERSPAVALHLKRMVDVAAAVFLLTVLMPLLLLIAALIELQSPGPILYTALRAGRKGRPFRCYKFRTMVQNADELKAQLRQNNQREGPFFKIAGDPRITLLGGLLRRYSLDELPQLWNVLRGDMSLVGPRPHPLDDFECYGIEHFARLDMLPGITGLWQVTARRDPSFQRGMELDREYIRTWSLRSDLRILLKTVQAVIGGSGD